MQIDREEFPWNGYSIVEDDTNMSMRRRVSRIIALEMKKPTPLIMVEKGRGFIYVQETDQAMELFEKFGLTSADIVKKPTRPYLDVVAHSPAW